MHIKALQSGPIRESRMEILESGPKGSCRGKAHNICDTVLGPSDAAAKLFHCLADWYDTPNNRWLYW